MGREALKIAAIEKVKAKERQAEYHGNQYDNKSAPVEPVPQVQKENGKARDMVGEKLGVSGKHADHAAKVVKVIDTLENEGKSVFIHSPAAY